MIKITMIVVISFIFLVVAGLLVGLFMSNVETPKYHVLKKDKNIEIREYPSLLVAQTLKPGERESAINEGFRTLADYIFGNNQVNSKITLPEQSAQHEKIAMTAPVIQNKIDSEWKILFFMPSKYNSNNIPQPLNENVSIQTEHKKQYIVIRFSGSTSKENLDENLNKLVDYIHANKIITKGSPLFAFYNPPWTLPFLRRNEIWFELPH